MLPQLRAILSTKNFCRKYLPEINIEWPKCDDKTHLPTNHRGTLKRHEEIPQGKMFNPNLSHMTWTLYLSYKGI